MVQPFLVPFLARVVVVLGLVAILPSPVEGQRAAGAPAGTAAAALALSGEAQGPTPPQAAGRVINRRTYHVYPGQFMEFLALAEDLREMTRKEFGRDFRILTARYGPSFHTVVLELEFATEDELQEFSGLWYPVLHERGYVKRWFPFVQGGTSELWITR